MRFVQSHELDKIVCLFLGICFSVPKSIGYSFHYIFC